jgi:hypothetical protein
MGDAIGDEVLSKAGPFIRRGSAACCEQGNSLEAPYHRPR